jgi:predicted TIM-barrel fold metal-dependent hydrolase
MEADEMILVSIDDHAIEPPDLFHDFVPAELRDRAPHVVTENGIERWTFEGTDITTPFGMCAVVSWPKSEWGFNPGKLGEVRPGCYDVHERVRDMNANGVLASMCFPTMAGFNARTFYEAEDKELALGMLRAYNDWMRDAWCGAYPGRFIPMAIVPMWDAELCASEVRRMADGGVKAISYIEAPHAFGMPSLHTDYWDPMFSAMSDVGSVLCMHIGGSGRLLTLAPEAPIDHQIVLPTQLTLMTAQDLLFSPVFRKFPDLKVALSEGGIGWIPHYLERADRHVQNQSWIDNDFGNKLPSDVFREHFLACFITDPAGLKLRHEIGVDVIAWECDYPHTDTTWPNSPELLHAELAEAGASDDEINRITFENSCRFFDFDPFARVPKAEATVGALRALASDVDTTTTSKAEYLARFEAAQHASA